MTTPSVTTAKMTNGSLIEAQVRGDHTRNIAALYLICSVLLLYLIFHHTYDIQEGRETLRHQHERQRDEL